MYKIVFVYGSLMAGFDNYRIIKEGFHIFLGHHKVKGRLYTINDSFPAMSLNTSNSIIEGQLYLVSNDVAKNITILEGSLYTERNLPLDVRHYLDLIRLYLPFYATKASEIMNIRCTYYEATPNLIKGLKPIRFNSWYNYKKVVNPHREGKSLLSAVENAWKGACNVELKVMYPAFYKSLKTLLK